MVPPGTYSKNLYNLANQRKMLIKIHTCSKTLDFPRNRGKQLYLGDRGPSKCRSQT